MQRKVGAHQKNQIWMGQCKQLLSEYMQVNDGLKNQNQELKCNIKQLEIRLKKSQNNQVQLQCQIQQYQKKQLKYVSLEEQFKQNIQKQKVKFEKDLQIVTRQLDQEKKYKIQVEKQVRKKDIERQELQKLLRESKANLTQTMNHIKFLKNENQNMRKTFHDHQRKYQQEIQRLKDLNYDVKKQFNLIQKDYSEIIKISQDQSIFQTPAIIHKSQKTKEKDTKVLLPEKNNASKRSKSINVYAKDADNPEMTNQLLKIKKEIAVQYDKLNEKKQTYLKQRVNKTLENIETLCSQMSYRLQEQSSTYE